MIVLSPLASVARWLGVTSVIASLAGCHPAQTSTAAPAPAVAASTLEAAPDQFVTWNGARLRYREAGRGEPVLLLHGYTQSIELMADIADSLAGGHRVIVIDQRGFGQSTKFAEPDRYARHFADDAVRLLDHLGIRSAHLVGHSMGALVATDIAVRYPARAATLSLLAGPYYADSTSFAGMSEPYVRALERGEGLTAFLVWLFPGMPDSLAAGFSAQALAQNDLGALIGAMRSMGGLMLHRDQASAIRAPVLVAVGTGDPLLPQSRAVAAMLPRAQLVEVAGVNHDGIRAHGQVVAAIRTMIQQRK